MQDFIDETGGFRKKDFSIEPDNAFEQLRKGYEKSLGEPQVIPTELTDALTPAVLGLLVPQVGAAQLLNLGVQGIKLGKTGVILGAKIAALTAKQGLKNIPATIGIAAATGLTAEGIFKALTPEEKEVIKREATEFTNQNIVTDKIETTADKVAPTPHPEESVVTEEQKKTEEEITKQTSTLTGVSELDIEQYMKQYTAQQSLGDAGLNRMMQLFTSVVQDPDALGDKKDSFKSLLSQHIGEQTTVEGTLAGVAALNMFNRMVLNKEYEKEARMFKETIFSPWMVALWSIAAAFSPDPTATYNNWRQMLSDALGVQKEAHKQLVDAQGDAFNQFTMAIKLSREQENIRAQFNQQLAIQQSNQNLQLYRDQVNNAVKLQIDSVKNGNYGLTQVIKDIKDISQARKTIINGVTNGIEKLPDQLRLLEMKINQISNIAEHKRTQQDNAKLEELASIYNNLVKLLKTNGEDANKSLEALQIFEDQITTPIYEEVLKVAEETKRLRQEQFDNNKIIVPKGKK